MGSKFGGYEKRRRQIERTQRIRDKRTAKAALKLAKRELKREGHPVQQEEHYDSP
jgi:hypothetical protein